MTASLQQNVGEVEVFQQTRSIVSSVRRLYEVGSPVPATLILSMGPLSSSRKCRPAIAFGQGAAKACSGRMRGMASTPAEHLCDQRGRPYLRNGERHAAADPERERRRPACPVHGRSRRTTNRKHRRVPLKRHDEACARRQGDPLEDIGAAPWVEVVRGPAEERRCSCSGMIVGSFVGMTRS